MRLLLSVACGLTMLVASPAFTQSGAEYYGGSNEAFYDSGAYRVWVTGESAYRLWLDLDPSTGYNSNGNLYYVGERYICYRDGDDGQYHCGFYIDNAFTGELGYEG